MYRYILFDLDGTLTDPGLGITNSVAYALKKFGITVADRSELYPFIGPPLRESFMERYGLTDAESDDAIAYFREYFRPKGIFENAVYEGIPAMLAGLRAAGRVLVLATSKPEEFAVEILKHFGLYDYFDVVAGARMDETRTGKADVVAYAMALAGITDPGEAVMVGDREHDVLGARANGLPTVGVLYGYGSEEELSSAGAAFLARTPADLLNILL